MANDPVSQMKRLIGFLMDTLNMADNQAGNLARLAAELDSLVPIAKVEEAVRILENAHEYWNRDSNEEAMNDALWYMLDRIDEVLKVLGGQRGGANKG